MSRISLAVELMPSSLVGVVDFDVDGVGVFDVLGFDTELPSRLLWNRCEMSYGVDAISRFRRNDELPPKIRGPEKKIHHLLK